MHRAALVCFMAVILCFGSVSASAEAQDEPRVVVVFMDGVSIEDLSAASGVPGISGLLAKGTLGLMSSRSIGSASEADYLTLGSGERAALPVLPPADVSVGSAVSSTESPLGVSASDVFRARTGLSPSSIIQPFGEALAEYNMQGERGAPIGALGESVAGVGGAYVLGGNRTPSGQRNPAAAFAMDSHGRIGGGKLEDLSDVLDTSSSLKAFRSQRRADAALRSAFDSGHRLVVIDPGGFYRLSSSATVYTDSQASKMRLNAFQRAGQMIKAAESVLDFRRDTLMLVGVSRPLGSKEYENLVPVVMRGRAFSGGLLTSQSTRRVGLVSSMDIAPTVLSSLGLPVYQGMVGSTIGPSPARDDGLRLGGLMADQVRYESADAARKPTLYTLIALSTIVFFVVGVQVLIAGLLAKTREEAVPGYQLHLAAGASCLLLCASLVAMYAAPLLWHSSPLQVGLSVLCLALTFTLLPVALARRVRQSPIVLLSIAVIALVAVDVLSGGYLGSGSVLGYSVSAGSRFYGIGNEGMGLLLVAAALSGGLMADRSIRKGSKRSLIWLVGPSAAALILIAVPAWGANVGGTIAIAVSAASCLAFYFLGKHGDAALKRRARWKAVLAVVAAVAVTVAALLVADSLSGQSSHAARAGSSILRDGPEGAYRIAARKFELNLRLLRVSPWTQAIGASLAVILLSLVFHRKRVRERLSSERGMRASIFGAGLGVLAALVFNDSGVIAAGVALVFGVPGLVYWLYWPEPGTSEAWTVGSSGDATV